MELVSGSPSLYIPRMLKPLLVPYEDQKNMLERNMLDIELLVRYWDIYTGRNNAPMQDITEVSSSPHQKERKERIQTVPLYGKKMPDGSFQNHSVSFAACAQRDWSAFSKSTMLRDTGYMLPSRLKPTGPESTPMLTNKTWICVLWDTQTKIILCYVFYTIADSPQNTALVHGLGSNFDDITMEHEACRHVWDTMQDAFLTLCHRHIVKNHKIQAMEIQCNTNRVREHYLASRFIRWRCYKLHTTIAPPTEAWLRDVTRPIRISKVQSTQTSLTDDDYIQPRTFINLDTGEDEDIPFSLVLLSDDYQGTTNTYDSKNFTDKLRNSLETNTIPWDLLYLEQNNQDKGQRGVYNRPAQPSIQQLQNTKLLLQYGARITTGDNLLKLLAFTEVFYIPMLQWIAREHVPSLKLLLGMLRELQLNKENATSEIAPGDNPQKRRKRLQIHGSTNEPEAP